MAELKTKKSNASVKDFLRSIRNEQIRLDSLQIASLMKEATKAQPKMWGTNIVGFGTSNLEYVDGTQREWLKIAFSPREKKITLYLPSFESRKKFESALGKYSASKACIHIQKLSDIHLPALKKLLKESVKQKDCGCKT